MRAQGPRGSAHPRCGPWRGRAPAVNFSDSQSFRGTLEGVEKACGTGQRRDTEKGGNGRREEQQPCSAAADHTGARRSRLFWWTGPGRRLKGRNKIYPSGFVFCEPGSLARPSACFGEQIRLTKQAIWFLPHPREKGSGFKRLQPVAFI